MLDLDSSSLTNEEKTLLQNPHVGGVILFSRNIVSKNQVLSLCHQIAEVNPNLLIAVDQEGGRVQRLIDGYAVLPSMQKLGKFVAQDKDNGLIFICNNIEGSFSLYEKNGNNLGVFNVGDKINSTQEIEIIEFISETGLQIKSDPGIPLLYVAVSYTHLTLPTSDLV